MKKIILGILALVLIGAGAFIIQKQRQDIGYRLERAEGEDFIQILINSPEKRTAPLVPPGLKEGEVSEVVGTAYRLVKKDKFYFAVLAIMPELEEGQAYQVKLSKQGEEFVIGSFNRNETGQWFIWHKEDNSFSFNEVRVLRGGDVVLGGNF